MTRKKEKRLPAWTEFERCTELHMQPQAAEVIRRAKEAGHVEGAFFVNSRYQVEVRNITGDNAPPYLKLWHLSIKRVDKDVVGAEHFRDFQRIKNELIGEEAEAVELYPAESRLVDTSNQYHLWAVEGGTVGEVFSFGFGQRDIVLGHDQGFGGSRQEPFEPGAEPEDAKTIEQAQRDSMDRPLDPGLRR